MSDTSVIHIRYVTILFDQGLGDLLVLVPSGGREHEEARRALGVDHLVLVGVVQVEPLQGLGVAPRPIPTPGAALWQT